MQKQKKIKQAVAPPVRPVTSALQANASDLQVELSWFKAVLDARLKSYFNNEVPDVPLAELPQPPALADSSYAGCIKEYGFGLMERIALILALVPHIHPRFLDVFFAKNATFDRAFTEFGGYTHPRHPGFLPTGETLAFLLAANDLESRFALMELFEPTHPFSRHQILKLEQGPEGGPPLSGKLEVSADYLSLFTTGKEYQPGFGAQFPAQIIETRQEWSDLVLPTSTLERLEEIITWIEYGKTLMLDWDMQRKLRPGFRCLFHGPPGTGKTMTAGLLGKRTGQAVYKVDLSLVISKYIGETEKNLAKIFDQAESKGWILFFDEADALFGKRTEVQDAHDRYANQEVSFLLQRIETFDGIVILASNQRGLLDDAFTRRFEAVIYFPSPKPEQRLRIWQQGFSPKAQLAEDVDLRQIAARFELSGGSIMNVIRYVSLQALAYGGGVIGVEDLEGGVRREGL